jgi:hypothetical protein
MKVIAGAAYRIYFTGRCLSSPSLTAVFIWWFFTSIDHLEDKGVYCTNIVQNIVYSPTQLRWATQPFVGQIWKGESCTTQWLYRQMMQNIVLCLHSDSQSLLVMFSETRRKLYRMSGEIHFSVLRWGSLMVWVVYVSSQTVQEEEVWEREVRRSWWP